MAISAAPDPPAPAGARKLSEELAALQEQFAKQEMTLGDVIAALKDRAYLTLIILLTLPFLTPIPLPGVSTPFGLAIAWISLLMVLGRPPSLPRRLREKRIPTGFFEKVFKFAAWILRIVEKLLRPRLRRFTDSPAPLRLHALMIFVSALVLLLPLIIPFSNTFPGWVILLIAAGLVERDGLFTAAGYVVFGFGVGYFLFLGEAAGKLFHVLRIWLGG